MRPALAGLGFVVASALGCGGGPTQPQAGETALMLTITFSADADELDVSGQTLGAKGRHFGPWKTREDVVSGTTIALIFDPSDAGSTLICVNALRNGSVRVHACKTFTIIAATVKAGLLHLS
jgi:hypothetical protein